MKMFVMVAHPSTSASWVLRSQTYATVPDSCNATQGLTHAQQSAHSPCSISSLVHTPSRPQNPLPHSPHIVLDLPLSISQFSFNKSLLDSHIGAQHISLCVLPPLRYKHSPCGPGNIAHHHHISQTVLNPTHFVPSQHFLSSRQKLPSSRFFFKPTNKQIMKHWLFLFSFVWLWFCPY